MRIVLIIFSLLFVKNAVAQLQGQPLIDSLQKQLTIAKIDSVKARIYVKLVDVTLTNTPQKAMQYANSGLALVTAMQWLKGIAGLKKSKGLAYVALTKYDSALLLYNEALTIYLAEKDFTNAAILHNNIGTASLRQSSFNKAATSYFEGLVLAEKIADVKLTAKILSNISLVYFSQTDYNKALTYQKKALQIFKNENNVASLAESYSTIANTYQLKKDTGTAHQYYNNALLMYEKLADSIGIATVYTNMSNIFTEPIVNLAYKLKAQKIWNSINPAFPISVVNMGNIGLVYLDFARYDSLRKPNLPPEVPYNKNALLQKATDYLKQGIALSKQSGDVGNTAYLTGLLSEVDAAKADYKNAYFNIKTYYETNDSIFSQENKNNIANIEGQREVAIRDKEIQLNKLALSAQRKQRFGLLVGIILLTIIGTLFYRQSKLRKKTNTTLLHLNNELDEANKTKAKFFAIISHDLRGPVANFVNFLHLQTEEAAMLSKEQVILHQKRITTSAENLLENMENILLWSKGQMQNFKPVEKEIEVRHLFDLLQKDFSSYDAVELKFINEENIKIKVDKDYCFTILRNLTGNAINALRHTEGAFVEWKAWQIKQHIYFSVTDNGAGFPESLIENWHNQQQLVVSGRTGLGMVIVNDLAKAINCKVDIRNNAIGATVILQFLVYEVRN